MRVALLSDTLLPTPTPDGHGLGAMVAFQAGVLRDMGCTVTLYAAPRSGRVAAGVRLVTPDDAEATHDGERALARAALEDHARMPYDVFIDHGHTHILSRLFPHLPVINWYHDIYQPAARCAVLVSEGQRALMGAPYGGASAGGRGFERARVIPNLVEPPPDIYNPVPLEPPYVVFLGACLAYKQPLLALAAAARYGVRIVMAGRGTEALRTLLSGSESVEVLGGISGAAKWRLLRGARLLLQLGTSEAFGLTTVEALLCGTPVVAWAAGGSLDIIQYGVNGVFVPVGGRDTVGAVADAIARAWDLERALARRSAMRYAAIVHPAQLSPVDPEGDPGAPLEAYRRALDEAIRDCANGAWW